ncbi:hypothetical protein KY366_07715 [Candidatus Woesearchaeota archaeon]|nr:hypothetical protein [Candidatus Woesearchaeota archaeon]
MSLESITDLKKRIETGEIPPHKRKGFIDSLHARLIKGDIYKETPEAIEKVVELELEYGFEPHSRKLKNHPAYEENKKSIKALGYVRAGVSHDEADIANIKRGLERGLFTKEEYQKAVTKFENKKSLRALEEIKEGISGPAYFEVVYKKGENPINRGLERGLFTKEEYQKAVTKFEMSKSI